MKGLKKSFQRYIGIFACIVLCSVLLSGCSTSKKMTVMTQGTEGSTHQEDSYQVVLVMDTGVINDRSFNQGAWEGVQKYCEENGLSYKYYRSDVYDTEVFQQTIESAIGDKTEVVVCPGFTFEVPVYNVQKKYPNVKFVLLDGEPHSEDYSTYETSENTMAILFHEEQSGYFAGYAAVKEGYKQLGFMGGMELPAVIRYGFGYLQGIEDAAAELGENIDVYYTYTGSFVASPEAQQKAQDWYEQGTEVIFSCGGAVGDSVMNAAVNQDGKYVIGVDVDQYAESYTVITSAMKMLANAVYDALTDVYKGEFKGGATTTLDVTNNGVGIAMDNARFQNFTRDDYQKIFDQVVSGDVKIEVDITVQAQELEFEHVTVHQEVMAPSANSE